MRRIVLLALASAAAALALPAGADDVTGSKRMLCTPVVAIECEEDGDCESTPTLSRNAPQFVVFDLEKRTISTTEASKANRRTEIKQTESADGQIFMQGYEQGSAWSAAITEETGRVRLSIVSDDEVIVIFGACTPLPLNK